MYLSPAPAGLYVTADRRRRAKHSRYCLKQRVMGLCSRFVYIGLRGIIVSNSSNNAVQIKLLGGKYRFIYFGTNFMKGFIRSAGHIVLPVEV